MLVLLALMRRAGVGSSKATVTIDIERVAGLDERRKRGGLSAWLLLADREPEARSDADASAVLVVPIVPRVPIVLVQVAGRVAQLAELAAQLRQ